MREKEEQRVRLRSEGATVKEKRGAARSGLLALQFWEQMGLGQTTVRRCEGAEGRRGEPRL